MTKPTFEEFVRALPGGGFCDGVGANGAACAIQALNLYERGKDTDDPREARSFDLRPLNDAFATVEARTKHLLPVVEAYRGSLDWPKERQKQVVERIVIGTVRRIVAELPGLPEDVREKCRAVKTLAEAEAAAEAAEAAAEAAEGAAEAAKAAAKAAGYAASLSENKEAHNRIAAIACEVWLEAVK